MPPTPSLVPERETRTLPGFTERPAWRGVGDGWRHLHGSVNGLGVSFEWHDFQPSEVFDWGATFHPRSVEICLNVTGNGQIICNGRATAFPPMTAGFYRRGDKPVQAIRQAQQRHQFLTVEMSFEFLQRRLSNFASSLHSVVRQALVARSGASAVTAPIRMNSRLQQILVSLREPPVLEASQQLWYQAKALELAADLFYVAPGDEELFCQRQSRLSAGRVEKVIALLRENVAEPPTLEEIGRRVGCSPFHLSRTFSAATGLTIPQYLRQLRMERAAELLRSGRFNVTEAALEVGYSSMSHFSYAFHETFGCCPGLYPLRTPSQSASLSRKR